MQGSCQTGDSGRDPDGCIELLSGRTLAVTGGDEPTVRSFSFSFFAPKYPSDGIDTAHLTFYVSQPWFVCVFRRDYSYVPTQAIQPLAWMSARYETQNHDSRIAICRGTSRPSFSASRWGGTESASATGQYLRNPSRGSI